MNYMDINNLEKKLMTVYQLRVDNKINSVKRLRKILSPIQFMDINTIPTPIEEKKTIKRKTLFGL